MKYLLLTLLLFTTKNITAQIDTTDWYPLHIGDKWEYYGQGFGYSQVEVIGDTLMQNGNTYYIFSDGVYAWRFQRKENDSLVFAYNYTNNTDYLLFNFVGEEKTLWDVPFDHYWGIFETNLDNYNLLNVQLPYKVFESAMIDTTINPPDTTWGYLIDAYPTRITKGLGVTSYTYDLTYLVGALINGVGYGTLVSVKENTDAVNKFKLYQNYPNPFNPSTIIKYSIPTESHIVINVFNTLGEKVTILFMGRKNRGEHSIKFNGNNLPSGTYFIQLSAGNYSQTIKAILIK